MRRNKLRISTVWLGAALALALSSVLCVPKQGHNGANEAESNATTRVLERAKHEQNSREAPEAEHEKVLTGKAVNNQQSFTSDVVLVTQRTHSTGFDVAVFDESGTLYTGGADGSILTWDTAVGSIRNRRQAHTGAILSVDVMGDGSVLASCGEDGVAQFFHLVDNAELSSVKCHEGQAGAVRFSPKGDAVALGCTGVVTVYSWPKLKKQHTLSSGEWLVSSLLFNADGSFLVARDHDDHAVLWDLQTGAVKLDIPKASALFFSSPTTLVVLDEREKEEITVFELEGKGSGTVHSAPQLSVHCFHADSQSRRFATCSAEGTAWLGSFDDPTDIAKLPFDEPLQGIVLIPKSSDLLVLTELSSVKRVSESGVVLWSVAPNQAVVTTVLSFSEQNAIVVGDQLGRVSTWKMHPTELASSAQVHQESIVYSVRAASATRFATASQKEVMVWELFNSEPLVVIDGYEEVVGLALNHDGTHVLIGGSRGETDVMSVESYIVDRKKVEAKWPSTYPLQARLLGYNKKTSQVYRVIYRERRDPTFTFTSYSLSTTNLIQRLALSESQQPDHMAISKDGSMVFLSTYPNGLIAIDTMGFSILWTEKTAAPVCGIGVVDGVGVWTLLCGHSLIVRDRVNGDIISTYELAAPVLTGDLSDDGKVFVGACHEAVLSSNLDTGRTIHLVQDSDGAWIAIDEKGYFVSSEQAGSFRLLHQDSLFEPSQFPFSDNRIDSLFQAK